MNFGILFCMCGKFHCDCDRAYTEYIDYFCQCRHVYTVISFISVSQYFLYLLLFYKNAIVYKKDLYIYLLEGERD